MAKKKSTDSDLSLKVPAHMATWAYLGGNEGLDASFPDAGALKLSSLDYWNRVGAGSKRSASKALALRLDDHFADWMYVPYEKGMDFAKAISGMFDLTNVGKTTIRQLADKVNAVYKFDGETN